MRQPAPNAFGVPLSRFTPRVGGCSAYYIKPLTHAMSLSSIELWDSWRSSAEIRELAEGWITKPEREWSSDDDAFADILHREPDRALATIFAIMQLTEDKRVLGGLAAGPFEDFLGVHGEAYLTVIHTLALQHQRLREVLDGVWQGSMPKRVWHQIEILKQKAFT